MKISQIPENTSPVSTDYILSEQTSPTPTTKRVKLLNLIALVFSGQNDGWFNANETITYGGSSNTFSCSAALAAVLQIGDKIKITQTTTKYFYIINIVGTTVTVTGGNDYTLINAAITAIYYSHSQSPVGFPQWFSYTPTWTATTTNPTLGNGVLNGRFTINGRTVTIVGTLSVGSTTTMGSGVYYWALPVQNSTNSVYFGSFQARRTGSALFIGVPYVGSSTGYDGSTPTNKFSVWPYNSGSQFTNSSPAVWANTDIFGWTLTYEI